MKTETQPTSVQPKHTQGKLEAIGLSDNSYEIFGDDKEGKAEFICRVEGHDVYKNLANAKRVEKAWNMHDELIEENNELKEWKRQQIEIISPILDYMK